MRPARLLAVLVGACTLGGTAMAVAQEPEAPAPDDGEVLFVEGCSSCHGAGGGGTEQGPSLLGSGEAAAFYYLSTGRMPLSNAGEQPRRKDPAYSPEEIELLVAYVAGLGQGPALPAPDLAGADLAVGGEVFRENCQACHSASGAGGALSYGRAAPQLRPADDREIAAAVRAGPGQMPVFGSDLVSDEELDDLVAYVEYLDDPADPGGLPIGRTGPIPEGFVAWLVGIGALLACVWWIGTRSPVGKPDGRRQDAGDAGPGGHLAGGEESASDEPHRSGGQDARSGAV